MSLIQDLIRKAQEDVQTIVMPENEDQRVLEAAVEAANQGIANIILLGTEEESRAVVPDLDTSHLRFIDPVSSHHFESFSEQFYELRKRKGVSPEKAKESMRDKTVFGMMLVKNGLADGLVSGAVHSTADTLRPALQILKTKPGTSMVSAFFLMVVKAPFGHDGVMVFGDCGLNEDPTAEQLADIAIASAESYRFFTDDTPRVALLSYSTFGSAHSHLTEKVIEATELAHQKAPELELDGEIQVDAALVPSTRQRKAKDCHLTDNANVLIFPNLDAGNIGYKLVQYLGGAEAYGPLLQGIAKPVNDLSRGCSARDIVGVIAITAVQSQATRS